MNRTRHTRRIEIRTSEGHGGIFYIACGQGIATQYDAESKRKHVLRITGAHHAIVNWSHCEPCYKRARAEGRI